MRRRLLWSLLLASVVLNVMYGAIAGILVPAQIAIADPAGKEVNLAVTMTASSLITLLARPLVGWASDRTSGRWGRRTPWMVGGALAASVALIPLGQATAVLAIALGWLVVQPLLNVVEVPLDTVLADRFTPAQRPRASAIYGGGAAAGIAVGAGAAGLLLGRPGIVYPALAALLAVTIVGFVLLNKDSSQAPGRFRLPLRRAWTNRTLQLVFAGRLLLVLGHQLVQGYLLYLVMAFTGVSVDSAGGTVTMLIGAHIACLVLGAWFAANRVGDHRIPWILWSSAMIAGGLLLLWAFPSFVGLALYAIVAGAGRGMYLTADLALMIDVLPSSGDHGRDLGFLGLATVLPQVLAPALAGMVLVASGQHYRLLVFLAAVGVLGSMVVMARVRPPTVTPTGDGPAPWPARRRGTSLRASGTGSVSGS